MDARVNDHLGDSISVTLRDGTTHALIAFVTVSAAGVGSEGTDPNRQLGHVKIDKTPANAAVLPSGPASIARLTTARLPGVFKPAADTIDDDGGAWLFDLQKARTP